MKSTILKIKTNEQLADGVFKMRLSGDCTELSRPGQFINIAIDGLFLRRPISVCEYSDNELLIIYKVVGKGTELMSVMLPESSLDVLIPLGNGFDTSVSGDTPLLIGGGVGTPPIYGLAKALVNEGKQVTVVLGFNGKKDVFYKEEFEALGARVHISTVDGSMDTKGFVTDIIKALPTPSYYYACGPEPMLKAVYKLCGTNGEMSFEERMGCGFGACMGCSCKTLTGNIRICKEGPVIKCGILRYGETEEKGDE